jgi:hypothetical protein
MKTQKFLFRYFTLAIGFSMLSSSVLAAEDINTFNPWASQGTLQKLALLNTKQAISPTYIPSSLDKGNGTPYAKLSYLMISTFPGECKAGANYDLTNVPSKTFGKYTMKPVCAKFKSVAADIVDAREAFFNSIPEVKEFYKQEALAQKVKEEKAIEKEAVAKAPGPEVIILGAAPSIDKPTSQVALVEAAPASSVVASNGIAKRNSFGLLPGDKGFDPEALENINRKCDHSTTTGRTSDMRDKKICYDTRKDLEDAVVGTGDASIEGRQMAAIQKQKAKYNEGIASGSISFDNDTCSSSGFSESECSQMKTNSERSLASTEKKVEKEAATDDASTLDNISGIDVSNGKEVDPNELFNVGSDDDPIMVPGIAINSINEAANRCLKGPDEAGDINPETKSNRCEKVAVASCNSEEGYCTELRNKATANDNNVAEEVMPNVKDINNTSELAKKLDISDIDCMAMLEGKIPDSVDVSDTYKNHKFLNEDLSSEEGDYSVISDRVSGIMYIDSQSCNEVLKTNRNDFTSIRGVLKINSNKKQFCKDVLQASFNANPENESCTTAFKLINQKKKGEKCFVKMLSDDEINDQAIAKCKEGVESNVANMVAKGHAPPSSDSMFESLSICDAKVGQGAGKHKIDTDCTIAYDAVKSCFASTSTDKTPNYTQLVAGCIGLNQIANNILDDKSIDDGETSYQSIDSQIKCKLRNEGSMVYAIDYLACRDAAYWYNGAFLTTDLAAPVIGSAINAYKDADIQGDMQREMASGGVDGQTAALRAQKRKYQAQAGAEAIQGTLQGAKALAMFGNLAMYPTPDVVSNEWCVAGEGNTLGLNRVAACSVVHMAEQNNLIKEDLFANQSMKQVMLEKGFESLSKAIVHAIIAGSYKKRSKLVGEVEQALTDADFNQAENQFDAGDSFCALNPTLPSCSGTGGGRIVNSGADFSFGGIQPQGGGNLNELDNGGLNGSGSPNNAVMPSGKAKEDLGNILATDSNEKFDKGFNKVGAAKVGAGGGGGGDSGGGGGGASGGGGGGGGGGDSDAKAGTGPQKGFGKKTFGKYIAGSNGKFTSGGSVGGKKKSSNPFAALSGKGRNRKIASQVEKELLPKKVQLFEVISKRYAAVSKDRLDIAKENLLQKDGTK